mgnify:CR=1 FL=1
MEYLGPHLNENGSGHSQLRVPALPTYPYNEPGLAAPQSSLVEYWTILKRNKGTVLSLALLGSVVGVLLTIPQTRLYQARTSVEIENLNENFLHIKQLSPTESGGAAQASDIQTQIKIIQSDSLVQRVVDKLKTQDVPQDNSRLSLLRALLHLPDSAVENTYSTALQAARTSLKVRTAGLTRIVEIIVDSSDPKLAAAFANTLANEYIEQNLESRWQTTQKTSEWLSRQLDDMRIKLERSEDRLQQYARQAGLLVMSERTNVSEEKLRQLQQALSAAQADRITKQSRFEMANSSPADALPDVLGDSSIRDYQVKLTDLRRQIADLTSTFSSEYPKVKRAEAQAKILETAFDRERGAILRRIRNEYEEALRRERLLADDYAKQAMLVSGEGERGIQYGILKREVDSNRQLYDSMLGQLKQATITSALRASNIRIVDPAKPPAQPYRPDPTRNALGGLLTGFASGIAFVILRERADRSIHHPGDSPSYLGVAELGVIPSAASNNRRLGQLSSAGTSGALTRKSGQLLVETETWHSKPSPVAEAFRSTLVSILYAGTAGSRPNVIVFTSANPSEGKSTVVSNLAIALAEVGNKVLLIDADLRKPRLHQIYDVPSTPGLTDVLASPGTSPTVLGECVHVTAVPGLFLLTAGVRTSTATNLLYSQRMRELLKELKQQFDVIVIDTPPMLQIPDARVLGRLADRVILVIRSRFTTRDAAQAAFRRFQEDGTEVLGTILNCWNPKHSPYSYYGYYRYGYYGRTRRQEDPDEVSS